MFARLKNVLTGLSLAWRYRDIIRSFTTAWSRYPGVEDADLLRLWIRPLLTDVAALAVLTPTPIDDMVVRAAIRLVDNTHTWTAIHSLVLLGRDGGFVDGVLIPQDQQVMATCEIFRTVTSDMTESPTIILSAVGLLLTLLQQRRRR